MENLNGEEGVVQPWFEGANDKWKCFGLLSVAATVGLGLWRIRELRRQNTQLQRELGRNQLIIKDNDGVRKYSVYNSLFIREPFVEQAPDDKRPMQFHCHKKSRWWPSDGGTSDRAALEQCWWRVIFEPGLGKTHLKMNELEDLLEERQHIFCSYFRRRSQRLRIEEKIYEMPLEADAKAEFKKVLKSDRSCGNCLSFLWSGDKQRNGKEIWEFLQHYRRIVITNVEKGKRCNDFKFTLNEEEKSKK